MRVLIAPDSFKGSCGAGDVADAIARGWRRARPDDDLVVMPFADGGEGTLTAIEHARADARRVPITVTGPTGVPHPTSYLTLPEAAGVTAVVELASTSGIEVLPGGVLDGWNASSRGFGEAIASALTAGASRLIVAIGSSASTDAGVGMLTALGARFTDADGSAVAPGVVGLEQIAHADDTDLVPLPSRGVLVMSDVTNPLCGPTGAAAVYGPQKGIDDISRADAALAHAATFIPASPDAPGAGAAGGVGFGLLSWGASLASGGEVISDLIGLREAIAAADLVITGEGRFDEQSQFGKAVGIVTGHAQVSGVRVALVAGRIDADTGDFVASEVLVSRGDQAEILARAPQFITDAATDLARRIDAVMGEVAGA